MLEINNAKIFSNVIIENAVNQLKELTENPLYSDMKIRVMPDYHVGMNCTIGFTAKLQDKVIAPSLVGVDIGCGVKAIKLQRRVTDYNKFDNVVRSLFNQVKSDKEDLEKASALVDQLH